MQQKIRLLIISSLFLFSCKKQAEEIAKPFFSVRIIHSQTLYDTVNWYHTPNEHLLSPEPDETSGIIPSITNLYQYWLHEDKGNNPKLMLYDTMGQCRANFYIQGVEITDLEDIAIAEFETDTLVFLGDIGDNNKTREFIKLISIIDTKLTSDSIISGANIRNYKIKYPKNELGISIKEDCEAFCFDPISKSFYFFSKNAFKTQVYRLKWPLSIEGFNYLESIGEIAITNQMVTAADISTDGTYLMVKTYENIYYWERIALEPIETLLLLQPVRLPYLLEDHGEAACFSLQKNAYITVSEKIDQVPIKMSIYHQRF